MREVEASNAIRDLAAEMFGVSRHWHKRIVRAGPNTLQPYAQNPPDRERQIGGCYEELLGLGLDPA